MYIIIYNLKNHKDLEIAAEDLKATVAYKIKQLQWLRKFRHSHREIPAVIRHWTCTLKMCFKNREIANIPFS